VSRERRRNGFQETLRATEAALEAERDARMALEKQLAEALASSGSKEEQQVQSFIIHSDVALKSEEAAPIAPPKIGMVAQAPRFASDTSVISVAIDSVKSTVIAEEVFSDSSAVSIYDRPVGHVHTKASHKSGTHTPQLLALGDPEKKEKKDKKDKKEKKEKAEKKTPAPEAEAGEVVPEADLPAAEADPAAEEVWHEEGQTQEEAVDMAEPGLEVAEWQPETGEINAETLASEAEAPAQTLKIEHSGHVSVTLAWADQSEDPEVWGIGDDAADAAYAADEIAYAVSALTAPTAEEQASSSGEREKEVAAEVEDDSSEHGLNAIGATASDDSSENGLNALGAKERSLDEAEDEEEAEEDYEESTGF